MYIIVVEVIMKDIYSTFWKKKSHNNFENVFINAKWNPLKALRAIYDGKALKKYGEIWNCFGIC